MVRYDFKLLMVVYMIAPSGIAIEKLGGTNEDMVVCLCSCHRWLLV